MYCNMWKWDYPDLKVSRPVEDIGSLCQPFVHHPKVFADHTMRLGSDEDDGDGNGGIDNVAEHIKMARAKRNYLPLCRPKRSLSYQL